MADKDKFLDKEGLKLYEATQQQRFKDVKDSLSTVEGKIPKDNSGTVTDLSTRVDKLESGKVDKVNGKDLVLTTDITQITTNKSNIATLTSQLSDKADRSELDKIGDVKGTCTKAELASKTATARKQDIWVVSDDDNHLYMFIGVNVGNAGSTGFVDLGTHMSLSGYLTETAASNTYATKTTVNGIDARVTSIENQLDGLATFLETYI